MFSTRLPKPKPMTIKVVKNRTIYFYSNSYKLLLLLLLCLIHSPSLFSQIYIKENTSVFLEKDATLYIKNHNTQDSIHISKKGKVYVSHKSQIKGKIEGEIILYKNNSDIHEKNQIRLVSELGTSSKRKKKKVEINNQISNSTTKIFTLHSQHNPTYIVNGYKKDYSVIPTNLGALHYRIIASSFSNYTLTYYKRVKQLNSFYFFSNKEFIYHIFSKRGPPIKYLT